MTLLRTRAVCFDFQGTLARFREGDAYDLYIEAAAEHAVTLERNQLAMPSDAAWAEFATSEGPDHREHSWTEASYLEIRAMVHARRLMGAGIDPDLALTIGRRVDALESQAYRYVAYEDAIPAIDTLARAGIMSLVVSNHVWRLGEIAHSLFGNRFEAVLSSARVGVRKPHPLIFQRALTQLGVEPHEAESVLMVGDGFSEDIIGGRRAGMRTAFIVRNEGAAPPGDVRVIHSLHDVLSMVR